MTETTTNILNPEVINNPDQNASDILNSELINNPDLVEDSDKDSD